MRVQTITSLLGKLKKCLIPTGDNPFPFVDCFGDVLSDASKWWQQYVFIPNLLKCSRVTIAILIFATVFLLLPDSQGQELTIRLSDNLTHSIVFLLGVVIWAFQSWIGTRKILDEIEGPSDRCHKPQVSDGSTSNPKLQNKGHAGLAGWKTCFIGCLKSEGAWIEHLPRVLGLFVFIISTVALLYPVIEGRIALFSMHGVLILANLALALVFYKLLMNRRHWICRQMADIKITDVEQSSHWAALDTMHSISGKITIIYVTALLLLATFLPVWLGFTFGSAGITVLGFSSLTAVGNFIIRSIVTRNHKPDYGTATQFPVLTFLFLIAVVFSFINDNHGIRLVSGEPVVRPKLADFAKQWVDLNSAAGAQANPVTPRPMIFVATAGGGIRASHWTVAVLTHLTDNSPRFADSVFAISGVSGGSVGASIYDAILKENAACQTESGKDCLQIAAKKLLSRDFLGPVVSALLFNDLLQRFLPVGILPDRQKALEKGWEKAFATEVGSSNGGLAAPYSTLWNKTGGTGKWLPLLLLNNTHMETGKKIVASPFPLDPAGFLDDVDLFQLLNGRDIPLSSAAGNSARFTYVSPPGTLPYDGSFLKFWEDNGHILDGGYFENNGAGTLQALIQTLQALKNDAQQQSFFERYAIKPIVILITNDSDLVCEKSENESVECNNNVVIKPERQLADNAPAITDFNGEYTRLTDNSGANEVTGPLQGIFNTRAGHGISAVKNLIAWVNRCQLSPASCNLSGNTKPELFHFRIDLNDGEYAPALGWVLSKDSEELIWDKLQTSDHNKKEKDRLLGMLEGGAK